MKPNIAISLFVLGLIFLSACANGSGVTVVGTDTPEPLGQGTISGTLIANQKIALPNDAIVQLQLNAKSALGSPPVTTSQFPGLGKQVPIPYRLQYDTKLIDPNAVYTIQATISANGKPLFVTQVAPAVITQGNGTLNVKIVLVQYK